MKHNIKPWLLLACAALFSGQAMAQAQQTTEGAQKFLSLLISEAKADAVARFSEVQVKYSSQTWERKMIRGWIESEKTDQLLKQQLERSVVKISALDSCTTVIDEISNLADDVREYVPANFSEAYYTHDARWTPSFATMMAPPHRIAWSKASIVRDQNGVMAVMPDPRFRQLSLVFLTTNAELQDRIEYAMKFLQMSCDTTAATGF